MTEGIVGTDGFYIREMALKLAEESAEKKISYHGKDPMDADSIVEDAKKFEKYLIGSTEKNEND